MKPKRRLQRLLSFVGCLLFSLVSTRADKLDDFVLAVMKKHHVPGLSMAVIQNGEIVRAQGYGLADTNSNTPVTPTTLFQAGSISKPVAALGALHLVESGAVSLDADVNTKLQTWKLPENKCTKDEKVTLRRLLSHSAGTTVHGFPGYSVAKPIPMLVEVLDGKAPANTAAIRVDIVPGGTLRYSGGGYTVMQQMVIDVTGKSFPDFMLETVLKPLNMTNSTYEQPLPKAWVDRSATGYYDGGKPVEGKWHIYPEMAAAGLWTTPSDLARFAIGIQHAFAGNSNGVLSATMTRQMLTRQIESAGLGLFLEGDGRTLRFMHSGRDEGFDAELVAYAETGQGAVIMINANNNSKAVHLIIEAIARQYRWPDFH